jgi:hypothetical protein
MKVSFSQFYLEPDATFPFSHIFQGYISDMVTSLVRPSEKFKSKYGSRFHVVFKIDAKRRLRKTLIKGPIRRRSKKELEYFIYLPYGAITDMPDPNRAAVAFLLDAVRDVFREYEIDTTALEEQRDAIIEHIFSHPEMLREPSEY